MAQSSSVASPRVSASGPASERARPSTRSSTPDSRSSPSTRGSNSPATSACTSRVSIALHTPGRWTLALTAMASASSRSAVASTYTWQLPEAAYITGTVACSVSAAFRPSPPRGMIRSIRPSWVAIWRISSRSPPATSEIAASGRSAAARAPWATRGQHGVGVGRRRRAPEHDGVARLQAQRRAVDRHVRARLVDHGDHAERHADAPQVQPVGEPVAVDGLADRVGQPADVEHRLGDALQPLLGERQPVDQRRVTGPPRRRPRRRARWPRGSPPSGRSSASAIASSAASFCAVPARASASEADRA